MGSKPGPGATARWTPVDLPQTAGEQSQDAAHPPPPLQTRRGVAATSRISLPLHPLKSATCFYQYQGWPSGPHAGDVCVAPQQPRAFKTPHNYQPLLAFTLSPVNTHWRGVGGVGRKDLLLENCLCLPSRQLQVPRSSQLSQRVRIQGHPDSPRRQTRCSQSSHPQHRALQVIHAQWEHIPGAPDFPGTTW